MTTYRANDIAFIMAQSTYGITIPLEAMTAIVLVVVVYIITTWWKGFMAKPDTLNARMDSLVKELSDLRIELNNLRNDLKSNTDHDERERASLQI